MTPAQKLASQQYKLDKAYKELDDMYPLSYAAKYGVNDYLEGVLLGDSNDGFSEKVNLTNENELTALHFACRYGHILATKMLLDKGARHTPTKMTGLYPIHMIFSDRVEPQISAELFQLLVGHRGDVKARTLQNESVAHFAAEKGIVAVLEFVKGQAPKLLESTDNHSIAPLLSAVMKNQIEAATYLLNNSNSSVMNSKSQNALHIAVLNANEQMVEALLPHFDITEHDGEGHTALELAEKTHQQEKVAIIKNALAGIALERANASSNSHSKR